MQKSLKQRSIQNVQPLRGSEHVRNPDTRSHAWARTTCRFTGAHPSPCLAIVDANLWPSGSIWHRPPCLSSCHLQRVATNEKERKRKSLTHRSTRFNQVKLCAASTQLYLMYSSIRMHLQIITFMDKLLKGMRPPEDHICEVNFKPVSPFFHFASVNVIIDLNGQIQILICYQIHYVAFVC